MSMIVLPFNMQINSKAVWMELPLLSTAFVDLPGEALKHGAFVSLSEGVCVFVCHLGRVFRQTVFEFIWLH